ncbi:MAG TPA: PASTA domain-containing protein [Pyrinomonadaceae bacterium]|nr:PASTA domain-containing protein [Pyrinomonadaceae bacterium]
MSQTIKSVTDEQTGQVFELVPEQKIDVIAAWISVVYSLAVIAYLAWLVLDTWSGQYKTWPASLTDQFNQTVSGNVFKLIIYTAVGGGMGAAINNIRGFVSWHAERRAFGWRFVWKYISLPPLGAALAVLVYGILQSGMAVFNGGAAVSTPTAITSFSAWATGTLAGYGSHKVFIWLDDKVNTLFKVEAKKVNVPDVIGKSPEEAKKILIDTQLSVETTEAATSVDKVGQVIGQRPAAGTEITCDSKVVITVGVRSDELDAGTPARPDVMGKTQEQTQQILQEGKPVQPVTEKSEVVTNGQKASTNGGQTATAATETAGVGAAAVEPAGVGAAAGETAGLGAAAGETAGLGAAALDSTTSTTEPSETVLIGTQDETSESMQEDETAAEENAALKSDEQKDNGQQ